MKIKIPSDKRKRKSIIIIATIIATGRILLFNKATIIKAATGKILLFNKATIIKAAIGKILQQILLLIAGIAVATGVGSIDYQCFLDSCVAGMTEY